MSFLTWDAFKTLPHENSFNIIACMPKYFFITIYLLITINIHKCVCLHISIFTVPNLYIQKDESLLYANVLIQLPYMYMNERYS